MKKYLCLLILNAIASLLLVAPAVAQQRPERTVYLVASPAMDPERSDPKGYGNRPERSRIAQFAGTYMDFQLKSVSGVRVVRGQNPCEAAVKDQVPKRTPSISYDLFLAVESFSFHGPEFVLKYVLRKSGADCTAEKKPLLQGSEPIITQTTLRAMTRIGELLVDTLEEELSPQKIVVDLAEISTPGEDIPAVKNQLAESILERLIVQSDVKVRDLRNGKPAPGQPDYLVEGRLISKPGLEFRFEFTITNKKGEKTTQRVGDQGVQYDQAATEVVNAINKQRFLGASSPATTEQIKQKALEYLCKGSLNPNPCFEQPNSAVLLLKLLTAENKGTAETFELLADAWWAAGQTMEAAENYDRALEKSGPGASVNLLIKDADAWYRAGNFDLALARVQRAIQLEESQKPNASAGLYVRLSQGYYSQGKNLKAVEAVLNGLKKYPKDDNLKGVLLVVLGQGYLEEKEPILKLLEANKDLKAVAAELPGFRRRMFNR